MLHHSGKSIGENGKTSKTTHQPSRIPFSRGQQKLASGPSPPTRRAGKQDTEPFTTIITSIATTTPSPHASALPRRLHNQSPFQPVSAPVPTPISPQPNKPRIHKASKTGPYPTGTHSETDNHPTLIRPEPALVRHCPHGTMASQQPLLTKTNSAARTKNGTGQSRPGDQ
jgi:hypothetical protein